MTDANPANPNDPAAPTNPAAAPVPPVATTEGLPEYEPLTPEMVEDEAVRGDFVMKWAVILLAVLFGCTLIVETSTLVHVKTGQYLSSHGILPPARDVLSSTADQVRWVNLNWLFDLVLAGVYGVGSFIGLSVFKAVVAGITFGIVCHTGRPGVSTWWGSICAGLAVLTCQPRLTAQPELITLLGVALTLWLLNGWLLSASPRKIWGLIPLCIVWSNLDSRAWWGPALLLLYGVGEYLGTVVGRLGVQTPSMRKTLWMAIGGAWLGLLCNPFLWQSWLAPFTQFGTIYPATLSYYPKRVDVLPLSSPEVWAVQPGPSLAGVVLFVTAAALIVINRRRLDFGFLVMLIGAAIPPLLATHELAAAAIVFCVIATVNGQSWFGATSTQDYSTETRALLFSRGGRAVTVLALFSLALLFTLGRLRPYGTAAVGLGVDPDLDGSIKSYQTVLKESLDDRPFNFTIEQGDLLIWVNQKPFIDQRLALFATSNPKASDSLVGVHHRLRDSLSPKAKGAVVKPSDRKYWKDEFNKLKITHCLPRLGALGVTMPDYRTFGDLFSSPDWQLARLGSATAVFYRTDLDQKDIKAYRAKNLFDMGDSYFKTEADVLPPRAGWAQLPTFYQRYIWKSHYRPSAEVREAQHLVLLAASTGDFGVGLIYQAIRRAQEGLSKDQNDAAAYEILAQAYMLLLDLESQGQMSAPTARLRYLQAVENYNLALIASPDNPSIHQALYRLYSMNSRIDLALEQVEWLYNHLSAQDIRDPERQNMQLKELESTATEMDRLTKVITQMTEEAKKLPKDITSNPYRHAMLYRQSGMTRKALEILQPADETGAQPPAEMGLRAELMLEAGQVEEAYELAGQLEAVAQQTGFQDWRRPYVATLLANAEYTGAAQTWKDQAASEEQTAMANVLQTLIPRNFGFAGQPWPVSTTQAVAKYYYSTPASTSGLNTYAALIYMEAGQINRAVEFFRLALKQDPEHPERPLVAYYLNKMTKNQWVDPIRPSDRVPIEFAPE